jgi:hypothetical protein
VNPPSRSSASVPDSGRDAGLAQAPPAGHKAASLGLVSEASGRRIKEARRNPKAIALV